ncbi:MAG: DNA circularization N-terminal domain-containing protein [Desulfobulbus sp.]|jgi:prophage DNA circulation protein|uniref:DNA circularization N-terminal domain-containing protein n=1 Tax=Desulfobulbus sp. TaxID=895 RepID=UPI0028420AB4|nr:DNA circularization N-terminal domain-containing protein [Desulfobulbus sp.]MDR2551458.1 DNA circularization N-terminal domain-containing protein [Desulfobulbus sp.]
MLDLYPAQLDGIDLEIEALDDEIAKAIVKHEYPHRNGALLEDMGQHARVVRVKCHFWDDGGSHQTYEAHLELLAHLDRMEIVELVHPNHGPMRGGIESIGIHFDDIERHAAIDIVFVQGLIEDTDDTVFEDVEGSAEAAYLDSIAEQKAEFGEDMLATIGLEANAIIGTALDPARGIVEQFDWVTGTARQYLQGVESFVGSLEGSLNIVAHPANSLMSIITYGNNLPGRVIGALARCAERYSISIGSSQTAAPERYVGSLATWSDELTAGSGDFAKTARIGTASQMALHTAYIYKADEDLRRTRRRSEGRPAFDALGRYTPPEYSAADPQPMTVQELENTLALARQRIQAAVDLARGAGSLKRAALTLMIHVNQVKIERDKLTTVTVDNSLPLHLICLRHGLPYGAADRLLSINQIRNPNEVSGEIVILADGAVGNRAAFVTVANRGEEVVFGGEEVTFGGEEVVFGGSAMATATAPASGSEDVMFGDEAVRFGGEKVAFGGALHVD